MRQAIWAVTFGVLMAGQAMSPAEAQPVWSYPAATGADVRSGLVRGPHDPPGAPRNVCFNAAALHLWCRVFVPAAPGSCVCGSAGGAVFSGTLITDAQLYELIGEDIKQAEVGPNGRRMAGQTQSSTHYGY